MRVPQNEHTLEKKENNTWTRNSKFGRYPLSIMFSGKSTLVGFLSMGNPPCWYPRFLSTPTIRRPPERSATHAASPPRWWTLALSPTVQRQGNVTRIILSIPGWMPGFNARLHQDQEMFGLPKFNMIRPWKIWCFQWKKNPLLLGRNPFSGFFMLVSIYCCITSGRIPVPKIRNRQVWWGSLDHENCRWGSQHVMFFVGILWCWEKETVHPNVIWKLGNWSTLDRNSGVFRVWKEGI